MSSNQTQNLVVGLDIGTSKVVTVVGQIHDETGEVEIIGIGSQPSKGIKKGAVVNIESTVQSISKSVEEAELMSGCRVHSVYVGIAGSHVKSLNSHGIEAIRDKEVSEADIERVIEAAQAVAIPSDQKVLHILPQEFLVDHQDGIREPLGMSGVRLEAKVHLVTCAVNAYQNVEKCVKKCGLEVEDIILEQLASSYSTLTEDEKDLGVCLIDMGGGTTDVAVFVGGAIRHTAVFAIAGDQITNDIAIALRTPTQSAEEIKIKYACAMTQMVHDGQIIHVPVVGDRQVQDISRIKLAEVVEARYDEIFTLVQEELRRQGFEDMLAAGIVLTGGCAKMEGVIELARDIFRMPVRVGFPQWVSGMSELIANPVYATAMGLLLYGKKQRQGGPLESVRREHFKGMFEKVKNWLKGNF